MLRDRSRGCSGRLPQVEGVSLVMLVDKRLDSRHHRKKREGAWRDGEGERLQSGEPKGEASGVSASSLLNADNFPAAGEVRDCPK